LGELFWYSLSSCWGTTGCTAATFTKPFTIPLDLGFSGPVRFYTYKPQPDDPAYAFMAYQLGCIRTTCSALGKSCGSWPDACGGTLTCGGACVVPINGSCSATIDTCTTGTYTAGTDTATNDIWSCTGLGGGTTAPCSKAKVTPNLKADFNSLMPVTVTVDGNPKTFPVTISNVGTASTGGGFTNVFQLATAPDGGGTVTQKSIFLTSAALGANLTTPVSAPYTFSSADIGDRSIRVCADKNLSMIGTIDEGSNEGDNCGTWVNVTVSAKCTNVIMVPHTSLCTDDDKLLDADTSSTFVDACSTPVGGSPKCEFACESGWHKEDGACVQDSSPGSCNPYVNSPSGLVLAPFANVGQLVIWTAGAPLPATYSWTPAGLGAVGGSPNVKTYSVRYSTIGSKTVSLNGNSCTIGTGTGTTLPIINNPDFHDF
jgi:hypothetical protein